MELPEHLENDEMTAAEMVEQMTKRGYTISSSYNFYLGKHVLRVTMGKYGHERYIPTDEIQEACIKEYLKDAINKINNMKGE